MVEKARIYLDHNASSPLRQEAHTAMLAVMGVCGNAASIHKEGRRMGAFLEAGRRQIAKLIGARPRDMVFTSGGTESANMAVSGLNALLNGTVSHADINTPPTVLHSALEHDAVRMSVAELPGKSINLPLTSKGQLDLCVLEETLNGMDGQPVLCLTLANNESGIIQPVREASEMVHECGGLVFCDAVQALGKIPIAAPELGADIVGFSSHKIGGPQGVGVIWVRPGLDIPAFLKGGGQENGKRSGTPNVIGIAGFGAAAACIDQKDLPHNGIMRLRDKLEAALLRIFPDAISIGADAPRLANTLCIALDEKPAETRIIQLDLAGFAASAGSACSSGKVRQSGLIAAMGYSDTIAKSAVRFSLGYTTHEAEIDQLIAYFQALANKS